MATEPIILEMQIVAQPNRVLESHTKVTVKSQEKKKSIIVRTNKAQRCSSNGVQLETMDTNKEKSPQSRRQKPALSTLNHILHVTSFSLKKPRGAIKIPKCQEFQYHLFPSSEIQCCMPLLPGPSARHGPKSFACSPESRTLPKHTCPSSPQHGLGVNLCERKYELLTCPLILIPVLANINTNRIPDSLLDTIM